MAPLSHGHMQDAGVLNGIVTGVTRWRRDHAWQATLRVSANSAHGADLSTPTYDEQMQRAFAVGGSGRFRARFLQSSITSTDRFDGLFAGA